MDVGHPNPDRDRREQHQQVFQNADPRDRAYAARQNKGCEQDDGNHHRWSAFNPAETGNGYDDAQPGHLQKEIREQEDNPDNADQRREIPVAVSHIEEVGLSL
jgi:hypothetical protein